MTPRWFSLVVIASACAPSTPIVAEKPRERSFSAPAPSFSAPAPSTEPSGVAGPSIARSTYPVEPSCFEPRALTKEKRSLPPRSSWEKVTLRAEKIALRAPPGVFTLKAYKGGSYLVSGLRVVVDTEPPEPWHVFGIKFWRLPRSIDAIFSEAEQAHATSTFVRHPEPMDFLGYLTKAETTRTTVAERPGYIWAAGAEGYNTDYVLVRVNDRETLLVVTDWISSAILGQPECYQRLVIGGVIDSISVEG